jgi:hypothetical protein
MQHGQEDEQDFFVVRFILMKIAAEKVDDAREIYDYYANKINSPLMNFTSKREIVK